MIDSPRLPIEVIGKEGLAQTLEAAAAQISAVEKQTSLQFAGVASSEAHIREIIDLHVGYQEKLDAAWRTAHTSVHDREHDERRVALDTLNARLNGFPREYASLTTVADLGLQIGKLVEDTRQRLEVANKSSSEATAALERRMVDGLAQIQKQITDGLALTQAAARQEARPGQDMSLKIGAIIAAVGLVALIIGVIIAVLGVLPSDAGQPLPVP